MINLDARITEDIVSGLREPENLSLRVVRLHHNGCRVQTNHTGTQGVTAQYLRAAAGIDSPIGSGD